MRNLVLSICLVACSLVALMSSEPTLGTAVVSGTVKSEDGTPLGSVLVSLVNTERKISVSVMTQRGGRYAADSLASGTYEIRAEKVGFEPLKRTDVQVRQSATVDLVLQRDLKSGGRISSRDAFAQFPEGPEKALLSDTCLRCHGMAFLLERRKDREGWRQTITRMVGYRFGINSLWNPKVSGWGGAPPSQSGASQTVADEKEKAKEQVIDRLVDYMAANFNPAVPAPKVIGDLPELREGESVRLTEYTIPYPGPPDKPVPSSNPAPIFPHNVVVDSRGTVWFAMYQSNRIGRLERNSALFQTYKVPTPGSEPHGIEVALDGAIWFTEQTGNHVGRVDPKTGVVSEIPTPDGGGNTIARDSQGNMWVTRPSTNRIGKVNVKTGESVGYDLPTPNATPYGIIVDQKDQVWWCQLFADSIAKLDPKTGKITEYPTPTKLSAPRRIDVDKKGNIWFTEWLSNRLGKMDPVTEKITEYELPSPGFEPYEVRVDAENAVWVAGFLSNTLARFDPATETFTEYPIATPRSEIRKMAPDPKHGIWFAESYRDMIGYLSVKR